MEDSLDFAAHSRPAEDEPAQDLYQALRQQHDFLLGLYQGLGKNHQEFQHTYHRLLKADDSGNTTDTNKAAQERNEVLRHYYEALQDHHAFVQDYLEALQDYYPLVLSIIQQESTDG